MTPRLLRKEFIHTTILVSSLLAIFCLMPGCSNGKQKGKIPKPVPIVKPTPIPIPEPIPEPIPPVSESESLVDPKSSFSNSRPTVFTESAVSIRKNTPPVPGDSVFGSVEIKLRNSPNKKPYKAIANVVVRAFQWRPPVTVVDSKTYSQNTNTESEAASAWQLVGETTTDLGGYYAFNDVITPGYPTFIEVTSMHRPTNPRFPKLYIIADPELSIDNYLGGANQECFAYNREERALEAESKDPKTCRHDSDCFISKNGALYHNYNSKGKPDGYKDTPADDDPEEEEEDEGYYQIEVEKKKSNVTNKSEKDPRSIGRQYPGCDCKYIYTADIENCLRRGPDKTKLTYADRIIYVIRKDIAGNDVISQPVPTPNNVAKAPERIDDDFNPIISFTITDGVLATRSVKAIEATEAVITHEDWYKPEGYTKPYADFPEKHKVGTSIQAIMRTINRFFVNNFNADTLYDDAFRLSMIENKTLHIHYFPHLGKQPEENDIDQNTVQRSIISRYDSDSRQQYTLLPPSMHLKREYGYHYPAQLFKILCRSEMYGNAPVPPVPGAKVIHFCHNPEGRSIIPGVLKGDKFNGYGKDHD